MLPFLLQLLHPSSTATQSAAIPSSAPVDPDWLLSSAVTSTAVLVAIVGGFLVSRLVGLSAERSSLIQRRHHRDELRDIKQDQYDEVHSERIAESSERFIGRHRSTVLTAFGDVDIESLLEDFVPRGSSDKEMRPTAERFVNTTRAAFLEILSKFPGNSPPPRTTSELRQAGVVVPEDAEDIYTSVANHIADHIYSQRQRGGYGVNFDPSLLSELAVSIPKIVYERQDARIAKEADLAVEIRALDKEISLVDQELSEIGRPAGINWSIALLAYLILVGITLPTILMALRPVPDSAVFRSFVVAAFISGLIALLLYLVLQVKALKPPPRTVHVRLRSGWRILPNRPSTRD